jgi:hypothetical protein
MDVENQLYTGKLITNLVYLFMQTWLNDFINLLLSLRPFETLIVSFGGNGLIVSQLKLRM